MACVLHNENVEKQNMFMVVGENHRKANSRHLRIIYRVLQKLTSIRGEVIDRPVHC